MVEIAAYRLNLLRAGYLLLIIGLGLTVWPSILDPAKSWELTRGVVVAMLGALSLLALIGLRHPLRMLPLLFWEVTWKTIWLLRMALPLWAGHRLDAATTENAVECLMVILIVAVIPWDFVLQVYVKGSGDRSRRHASQ
ncbi:hypothetical protein CLG96_06520 [Sphingomonas oleivorans]|uniref:Uncharacterized protein n=1 Tax=Sphingomonas oleivorans TaxID=1735121 RepID=A0A2T5FZR9_9SPHN|nr:hypothetical protein [Sphingomonas oleivorans]PTQ12202.1 hypothetical protein CLG96_06520 [Sphingomonas oleivorans]